VFAVVDALGRSDEAAGKAILVAGMIGVIVAEHATFAPEVGGSMVEYRSGAAMAAAAIVWLASGSLDQSLFASPLALQNSLDVICDPNGNRVAAPRHTDVETDLGPTWPRDVPVVERARFRAHGFRAFRGQ